MTTEQEVSDVLDETIQAFTQLDLHSLQALERRISILTESGISSRGDSLNLILAKQHLLQLLLQSCEANLDILNRLHGRNTREQWAH